MRVLLDANILFSAAKSDGPIRQLLRLLFDGGHECCVDVYVVSEAPRNLGAKGPDALKALELLLTEMGVIPPDAVGHRSAEIGWLPEKDRPALATAIRGRCDLLLTGDRMHFDSGYGKAFGGVKFCLPRLEESSAWRAFETFET